MGKLKFTPSPALYGKFKIVNTSDPILHSRIGDLDFRTITLEQAEKLVEAGTRYLQKIPPPNSKKRIKNSALDS